MTGTTKKRSANFAKLKKENVRVFCRSCNINCTAKRLNVRSPLGKTRFIIIRRAGVARLTARVRSDYTHVYCKSCDSASLDTRSTRFVWPDGTKAPGESSQSTRAFAGKGSRCGYIHCERRAGPGERRE